MVFSIRFVQNKDAGCGVSHRGRNLGCSIRNAAVDRIHIIGEPLSL
jgi:hypothetical protein